MTKLLSYGAAVKEHTTNKCRKKSMWHYVRQLFNKYTMLRCVQKYISLHSNPQHLRMCPCLEKGSFLAEVIALRIWGCVHPGLCRGALNPLPSVLIRHTQGDKRKRRRQCGHRGRDPHDVAASQGAARHAGKPPAAGRGPHRLFPRALAGVGPR